MQKRGISWNFQLGSEISLLREAGGRHSILVDSGIPVLNSPALR
jgi:hypothetical protein